MSTSSSEEGESKKGAKDSGVSGAKKRRKGKNKNQRRNIKDVMKDTELDADTRNAQVTILSVAIGISR